MMTDSDLPIFFLSFSINPVIDVDPANADKQVLRAPSLDPVQCKQFMIQKHFSSEHK